METEVLYYLILRLNIKLQLIKMICFRLQDKYQYIHQWYRVQSLEWTHTKQSFDFQQRYRETIGYLITTLSHSLYRITSKWIIDLNVRAKICGREYRRKSSWWWVRQRILWKDIKGTHHKRKKINKLNSIKMVTFALLNTLFRKWKDKPQAEETL